MIRILRLLAHLTRVKLLLLLGVVAGIDVLGGCTVLLQNGELDRVDLQT